MISSNRIDLVQKVLYQQNYLFSNCIGIKKHFVQYIAIEEKHLFRALVKGLINQSHDKFLYNTLRFVYE